MTKHITRYGGPPCNNDSTTEAVHQKLTIYHDMLTLSLQVMHKTLMTCHNKDASEVINFPSYNTILSEMGYEKCDSQIRIHRMQQLLWLLTT